MPGVIDSEKLLETQLRAILGDKTLRDISVPTLMTSVDVRDRSLKLFRNLRALRKDSENFYVRDVARATSAAPTYFPAARITSVGGTEEFPLIDGGLAANDPSVLAYAEAVTLFPGRKINIVSLGTGACRGVIYEAKEKSFLLRVKDIISTLFEG